MKQTGIAWIVALIVVAAFLRLLPHPPNFAPVVAMALFAGATLADRRLALLVPLLAMLASDLVIGFHDSMWAVYGALAVVAGTGRLLQGRLRLTTVSAGAVGASVVFFVLTNLAVWAMGGLYPRTLDGLAACFVAALPFFQNTLAGTLVYAALLFGGLALVRRLAPGAGVSPAESA